MGSNLTNKESLQNCLLPNRAVAGEKDANGWRPVERALLGTGE
jgi:hypothetical protein